VRTFEDLGEAGLLVGALLQVHRQVPAAHVLLGQAPAAVQEFQRLVGLSNLTIGRFIIIYVELGIGCSLCTMVRL